MHFKSLLFASLLATAGAAQPRPDQTEVQTFHFTHLQNAMAYQEIVTTLKQVTLVSPELPVDPVSGALIVSGTKDELAKAAWIVDKLDSADVDAPDRLYHQNAVSEKPFTGADGNVLDIFYLPSDAKAQDVQEMITTLRQVAEMNQIFCYTARRAVIFGAPADKAKLAEWLTRRMQDPVSGASADEDFRVAGAADDVARVLHWSSGLSPRDVQQLSRALREKAEISKLFQCGATRSLAVRGTAAQLAMATEMVANYQPSH